MTWSCPDQKIFLSLFPPGLEPGTFRVLGERDNHYTTETLHRDTNVPAFDICTSRTLFDICCLKSLIKQSVILTSVQAGVRWQNVPKATIFPVSDTSCVVSGWPSGLRRCVQVAVYLCRRGFESHF